MTDQTPMPRLWTEAEVAAYLGVNPETVARERRRGRLPFRKIGKLIRHTDGDIREYLDRCRACDAAIDAAMEREP